MQDTTLSFLLKDGKILLAMKKRGFGDGKWLSRVIKGEKVFGEIHFEDGGKKLGKVDLR